MARWRPGYDYLAHRKIGGLLAAGPREQPALEAAVDAVTPDEGASDVGLDADARDPGTAPA